MNPNIAELVTRYRGRGAVVDTNLFLVLLLGNVDPRLIGNTARTDGYSASDYDLLLTADRPLQSMAWSSGVDVLPFDWLRNA